MPRGNNDLIWELVDHVLATPQANRIVDSITHLVDRVGDRIEHAVDTAARPRPQQKARPRPQSKAKPRPRPKPLDPTQQAYQTLGVSPEATFEEIKRAYRHLMREHHPDLHPGDPRASAKASKINAAYEHLSSLRNQG